MKRGLPMSDISFFDSTLFQELTDDLKHLSRFTAVYQIHAATYEDAKKIAEGIAVEQTIECPVILVQGTWKETTIVGQIEEIKKSRPDYFHATISYDPNCVGGEMTELINMLFGNSSLQPGVRLMSFELPDVMYNDYPGPKFGRMGLRELCHVDEGPIMMSAIKPLGNNSQEFARMVYELALGGCPIIKDDHSLYNQSYAPFEERTKACIDAVNEANAKTGGHSLFIPNCTADGFTFFERALKAQEWGAGGIMAAPGLLGFPLIRELTKSSDFHLPVFLHPCFSGALVLSEDSGISSFCYYGQLGRLAGGDAVIFTGFGGRFAFSKDTCKRIVEGTDTTMADLKSAFPVPSGGMSYDLFPQMQQAYGNDVIFLVGGALQTHGSNLVENMKFYMEKIKELKK